VSHDCDKGFPNPVGYKILTKVDAKAAKCLNNGKPAKAAAVLPTMVMS